MIGTCTGREGREQASVLLSVMSLNVIGSFDVKWMGLELVSKELNHLAAILHVYARGLNFMK